MYIRYGITFMELRIVQAQQGADKLFVNMAKTNQLILDQA